jgi:diguanylate cyclase (GGDEF)-like protein/putative nucleotidyltransferase with HDIG domain
VRASREAKAQATKLATARAHIADLEDRLTKVSSRDAVVPGLLSLAAFRGQLEVDVQRAHRYGHALSVALIDVDRFRYLNLKHGYEAGNAVLSAVGAAVASGVRGSDLTCRTGGDEFAVLFGETTSAPAAGAIERVIVELEDIEAGEIRGLSASAGVAELTASDGPETLLARARDGLESARSGGGGRVSVAPIGGAATTSEEGASGDAAQALASALSERDRYTGEHSVSVVDLTGRIGESLALDAGDVSRVRMAALLHDIGKVGVPDAILNKPGPLDHGEWEIMRQHPVIGERILRAIPGMGSVARIVRHEHERWDGGGYPDGLTGPEIPVGARIILACDAYHAMTSNRPYRRAMAHKDAMAELSGNAGTQFDPNVVEVLVGHLYGRRQSGLAAV